MPNRPKKIRRPWRPERIPFGRRKDNSAFYNDRKWRKVSRAYREANPFCAECERNGKVSAADVADHKKGLQYLLDNDMDPYDWEELEGLCHPCHNSKSGKQAHGYKAS